MATKKTAIFTLTERLTLSDTTTQFATIDLGSYVDVGDRQGLQIHSVEYVYQGVDANAAIVAALGADQHLTTQVCDLNRGGLVFADDRALISSSILQIDQTNGPSNVTDMFPDNFGNGSEHGRYVVNDSLYIYAKASNAATALNVTVRVNASIVTLSAKDFMAIAIQSTAADN